MSLIILRARISIRKPKQMKNSYSFVFHNSILSKSKYLHCVSLKRFSQGSRKKISSHNGRAIKRGGGKGRAIKEKKTFFITFFFQRSNFPKAIKLEGGGQVLMARLLREELFFCGFPQLFGMDRFQSIHRKIFMRLRL